MKGKDVFNSADAELIIKLLDEKSKASKKEQVKKRSEIRKLGFYITDFDNSHRGFAADDFKLLIENGSIKISE